MRGLRIAVLVMVPSIALAAGGCRKEYSYDLAA